MKWFLMAWKRCFQFSGRSSRKDYWMFQLVNVLILLPLYIVSRMMESDDFNLSVPLAFFLLFYCLYALASILPIMSCGVRRLHDSGKTGWLVLLGLLPILNLALIVLMVIDSDPGTNQYGPNPKLPSEPAVIG